MLEVLPDNDEIIIPSAKAADEATAIAISPADLYFSLTNIIMNDAIITAGVETSSGEIFKAAEIESEAKPISESP